MDLTIDEAIKQLNDGNVIGVPTDTVYGLSTLVDFGEKIYEVKNRDDSKKLITMIANTEDLDVNDAVLLSKMDDVWPGAVTLIFKQDGEMRSFRIPNEPNLLHLLKKLQKPIYTTSANISGQEPCKTREEFKRIFPNIGLLKEDVKSVKSEIPSEIYIYENKHFERIR